MFSWPGCRRRVSALSCFHFNCREGGIDLSWCRRRTKVDCSFQVDALNALSPSSVSARDSRALSLPPPSPPNARATQTRRRRDAFSLPRSAYFQSPVTGWFLCGYIPYPERYLGCPMLKVTKRNLIMGTRGWFVGNFYLGW